MQVPVLKQGEYLIASIQAALSDADLLQLRDDLADRVGLVRSRGVIIDVTVLDVIDSFATRTLRAVAHMLKLRGAETVIVGIQPDVAFAMVQLGLTLEGIGTALDLEEGLAYLDDRLATRNRIHGTRSANLHQFGDGHRDRAPEGTWFGDRTRLRGLRSHLDRHRHLRGRPQYCRACGTRADRVGGAPSGQQTRPGHHRP